MKIYRNTILSVILSVVSLGSQMFDLIPPLAFDFRIVPGTFALFAFFVAMREYKRYTGNFQFVACFLAIAVLGISIDDISHVFPYITVSVLLVMLAGTYRAMCRKWVSESERLWIDPVVFCGATGLYLYGNISNNYGWPGWVFPLPVFLFNLIFIINGTRHSIGTMKYVIGNNLIHPTGKPAPDFCLPDHEGNEVKLSDFAGKRDVLLMFLRNAWCPSCHIMLRTYQRNSERFKEKNILLFAIGPDISEVNKQMAADLGIDFKVLSDEKQKIAMAYKVHLPSEVVGEPADGMPLPASFLVDRKGIIRYTSRADRIGEFLDPNSIFPILESLN